MKRKDKTTPAKDSRPVPVAFDRESVQTATVADMAALLEEDREALLVTVKATNR